MCLKEPSHVCLIKRALPTTRFVSREYQKKERETSPSAGVLFPKWVSYLSLLPNFLFLPHYGSGQHETGRSAYLSPDGTFFFFFFDFFFFSFWNTIAIAFKPLKSSLPTKKNELSLFFAPRPFFFFSEGKFEINKHKFP